MFLLMSLESVSTLELQKEIDECLDSHSKLLDYSKQPGTLILPAEQPPVQMEQPQPVYSWSDDARAAINEHQAYHTNMVTFLNHILVTGPPEKFPTQPKSKLKDLIMKKKTKTKTRKRTPEELHAYLQRTIVNVNKKINKDVFNFSVEEIKTPAEAMVKLREGYKHIKRQNAVVFYTIWKTPQRNISTTRTSTNSGRNFSDMGEVAFRKYWNSPILFTKTAGNCHITRTLSFISYSWSIF